VTLVPEDARFARIATTVWSKTKPDLEKAVVWMDSETGNELVLGAGTHAPITDEDGWDSTWENVMRLRSEQPHVRFECWQSVYIRGT